MNVPTWGYRKGEARVFDLPEGGKLPSGWYDSPAQIPSGEPPAGQGGERPVAAQASPVVSPPPPVSIDEQERAEHRRVLEENRQLKAYAADLESLLASADQPTPPPPAGVPEEGALPMTSTSIEKARAAKAAKRERRQT